MEASKKSDNPQSPRKLLAGVRPDAELMNVLSSSRGCDERSLEELVNRHQVLVSTELKIRNIRSADLNEIQSKVWQKVWELGRDQKWNPHRGRGGADPFVPLLKRICFTSAMDFYRQRKQDRKKLQKIADAVELYGKGDRWREELAFRSGRKRKNAVSVPSGVPDYLTDAVKKLDDKFRRVYELHARGMKNCDISKVVGCSNGETSRRLKGAREKLALLAAAPERDCPVG